MGNSVSKPLLAIDIGNSFIKLGLFDAEASDELPRPSEVMQTGALDAKLEPLLRLLPAEPIRWRVASVQRQAERNLAEWVLANRPTDNYRSYSRHDLPLTLDVKQPDTVGIDRLIAAVAVNRLRAENRPAIVVDAGTAVKVDAISSAGTFLGGAIAPGILMLAAALAEKADQLPLLQLSLDDEQPAAIGKSTEEAMRSGVFWGIKGSVRELVQQISEKLAGEPQLFLAGGFGTRLAPLLGSYSLYVPNLILSGIAAVANEESL